MPDQLDISNQMVQLMGIALPNLDTTIGSPVRAIIDSTAEVISEQTFDQYLISQQWDINTKSGADLDSYVKQFGFTRFPAKQATGYVTFALPAGVFATASIFIPAGTQVSTNGIPNVVFATIFPSTLATGQNSTSLPVQAAIGGTSGNIAASAIVAIASGGISGISTVNNSLPMSGGTDAESDDQLRLRFVSTVFRGMTGTAQMYLAVALDDPNVSLANVVGATTTYTEQIQISSGTGTSSVPDLKYYYENTQFFGNDLNAGDIFSPGSQYTIASSGPDTSAPVITVIDTVNIPDGVYQLQFDYLPSSSRNDPVNGKTNRIDIYVNGDREVEAVQNLTFENTLVFNNTDPIEANGLNVSQFVRIEDGVTHPSVSNIFVPLAYSPITAGAGTTPTNIVLNSNTYTEGSDYWFVNDSSIWGGGINSRAGLECDVSTMGASGNNGHAFTADFFFNQVPQSVQHSIENWRLITTDTLVHRANIIYLDLYLAVILNSGGFTIANVFPLVQTALSDYLTDLTFDGVVQVSEVLSLVQQVPGVAAVRFLNSGDSAVQVTSDGSTFSAAGSNYAIQSVNPVTDGLIHRYATGSGTPLRALDVQLTNSTLTQLNLLWLAQMTNNNFGAV